MLMARWPLSAAVCLLALCARLSTLHASDHPATPHPDDHPFTRPTRHDPPAVAGADWPAQPLDSFILARLESAGLSPSPLADPVALIRRVTFDLTGLPPTPDQVAAFLADPSPTAYESLVDHLLASPHFGERWAGPWLNAARYAEDQAHQVGDDEKHFYPNAYRYRDWVIAALNDDLAYDRFILLQLAADLLPDARPADLPALGFLGLGPKYYNRNRLEVKADEWEDRIDTLSRTFLGLTVACARCHDHKFDPISMADYYALAGIFASTEMLDAPIDGEPDKHTDPAAEKNKRPAPNVMHIVTEGEPTDMTIFNRGNVSDKGPVVPRRFLTVLSGGEPKPFTRGSGRLELALAIADADNPLTARVLVNRVWAELFGRGIVATPSNFGSLGSPPSHPELLDDLAARFVEEGWSIKHLIREIVLSSTYRQSSTRNEAADRIDPDNQLLWRMDRRALPIEMWRDALLAASGDLESKYVERRGQVTLSGGPSLDIDDPFNHRRTVYGRISRLKLNDLLRQFDYPDPNVHAEGRSTTISPLRKLFVMNSPFMIRRGERLAARLAEEAGPDDSARIDLAYQLLFARHPTPAEIQLAIDYLAGSTGDARSARWAQLAQAFLATNEMAYID